MWNGKEKREKDRHGNREIERERERFVKESRGRKERARALGVETKSSLKGLKHHFTRAKWREQERS